ncbi:cytochrome-c peroxidase [Ralstonia flatus]|uniref:Methylamine utilization protein MauG n=1 Tax=Ralstonia flatus TaxID=3058601 RepID=A0AAD2BYF1_9RALS|nr:cytochrome-c peroxidase [Ralstonia sp. LMG 32965]MBN6211915.1 cytochrome-c peroxidase [Ralstonia pickettii]CAJ0866495.1 Methylamine utilization protein MauG [Ralstonia sp. LMG 32965]CAJ0873937.1 Methylamine utilization protein MauG [Ralstonia sp. LMG 32965]
MKDKKSGGEARRTCRLAGASWRAASLLVATLLTACGGGDGGASSSSPASTSAETLSPMAQVGKQIFFDQALSASGKQSCASCHDPSRGFTDPNNLAVSIGGPNSDLPGLRNSPSLNYASFTPNFKVDSTGKASGGFFRDGRSASLADQAQQPFTNAFEMANASADDVLKTLLTRPYLDQFTAVFTEAGIQNSATAMQSIGRALAAFQSEDPSFHTFDSKFDAYLAGKTTLTDAETRGLLLFNNPTKGNCNACHISTGKGSTPALFTDFTYDNVGIPRNWSIAANQEGTPLPYVPKNGVALGNPNYSYYDLGMCGPLRTDFRVGGSTCGKFKVPTLRNIALTPPYFHNGVFQTLDQVVAWYITRDTDPGRWYVKADGTPDVPYNDLPVGFDANVNVAEVPYNPGTAPSLTNQEMSDLVHFLCTLTDGFDPANPSAYRVPAQCNSTAASVGAARIQTASASGATLSKTAASK